MYDDFSTPALDAAKWEIVTEAGPGHATPRIEAGRLVIEGAKDRSGIVSRARLGAKAAVEADALGYSGINQILQLYGPSAGFNTMVEVGIEGKDQSGTPTIHIWTPDGEVWSGPAPLPGDYGPDRPLHLRVERNGSAYRLLINGRLMHEFTSDAIPDEARVVLYGFGESVSRWDDIRLSGPPVSLTSPALGMPASLPLNVKADVGPGAVKTVSEAGLGDNPLKWMLLSPGWKPDANVIGPVTVRVRAEDVAGCSRSEWRTVALDRVALWEPVNGQIVGPAFNAGVGGAVSRYVRARFLDNGKPVGESASPPFHIRIIPRANGPHVIQAVLIAASGATVATPPIRVTVKRNLYGANTRVCGKGSAFVFPDGRVTVPIAFNDSYTWTGCDALFNSGDAKSVDDYVSKLRADGVNVVRMFLEAVVPEPGRLLESPLGRYNKPVVEFWDRFLPICERHGLTVLISPWDTFWINQPWTASPYNKANGGPCTIPRDFITMPEARKWEKARIRFMIDRWGASHAIFAIDLLNEHDIWWGASPEERQAWLNDMAAFTRAYELKKWGRVHMLTVSSAAAEPTGAIAEDVYHQPLFDFATTHLYYWGTVNDPKNAIDPVVSFNHGVRYALGQIQDGRPYTDSESGPIDRWIQQQPFDEQVFHHMSWAHLASGGAGAGMRWPYRSPHSLTPVMLRTLRSIAQVANRIDWASFISRNADNRLSSNSSGMLLMGSGDSRQVIAWLADDTRNHPGRRIGNATLRVKGLSPGRYEATCWDTKIGVPVKTATLKPVSGEIAIPLPSFESDIAVTVRPAPKAGTLTHNLWKTNHSCPRLVSDLPPSRS
jgi:mannan endo-1,4-beta-mannosidase